MRRTLFPPIILWSNFIYFTLVLVFAMFLMHPVCAGAHLHRCLHLLTAAQRQAGASFQSQIHAAADAFTALLNPLFNHQGMTVITLSGHRQPLNFGIDPLRAGSSSDAGNSDRLNSSCYNAVMTSDKFIYLFGRIIPSLSLLFSMVRFVPL